MRAAVTRCAAIDIGTNTVRLLVADRRPDGLHHAGRALEITRLGLGVDAHRKLDPDAVGRTLSAVERFARRAFDLGAGWVRVAGTSALRDAADPAAFSEAVTAATGSNLEILDGTSEGRLAFLGATFGAGAWPFVVCDVGGGSTEIVSASGSISLDVGSVRLRERCLAGDPPSGEEISAAAQVVRTALRDVTFVTGAETLIGVAGTITTIAALDAALETYESDTVHGYELSREAVRTWCDRIVVCTAEEIRRRWPVVEPGRSDVVGAGTLIVREVMERFGFDCLRVSERDILDGLILDAIQREG